MLLLSVVVASLVLELGCVVVSPFELGALTCVWALVFTLAVAPWILLDGACPLPDGVPPLFPGLFEVVLCWLGVLPELPPLLLALPACDVFPPLEFPPDDELLEGEVTEALFPLFPLFCLSFAFS